MSTRVAFIYTKCSTKTINVHLHTTCESQVCQKMGSIQYKMYGI